MKLFATFLLGLFLVGCATSKVAYQTIGALEASAVSANAAYLDAVVTGRAPTNDTPKIEAEFNATQLALHAAAAIASSGTNAAAPAATAVQVQNFTNRINSIIFK